MNKRNGVGNKVFPDTSPFTLFVLFWCAKSCPRTSLQSHYETPCIPSYPWSYAQHNSVVWHRKKRLKSGLESVNNFCTTRKRNFFSVGGYESVWSKMIYTFQFRNAINSSKPKLDVQRCMMVGISIVKLKYILKQKESKIIFTSVILE